MTTALRKTQTGVKAGLEAAPAPLSTEDEAARIGRELSRLHDERHFADEATIRAHQAKDETGKKRFSHMMDTAGRKAKACEILLQETQATSVPGAFAQLVLASGEVSSIVDNEFDWDEAEEYAKAALKLVDSAIAAIERATGLRREDFGGRYYMLDYEPYPEDQQMGDAA